ncbi:MAG: site-specific DNA-methyltransferase [Bacteroidia bacterium]|nr:site-specific DNA-methyltransferase [Bacteroidia bacterium]
MLKTAVRDFLSHPQQVEAVVFSDNWPLLYALPDKDVDLIYIDPPPNTRKIQTHLTLRVSNAQEGNWVGCGGKRYKSYIPFYTSYEGSLHDCLSFIESRLIETHRIFKPFGFLHLHIDCRETHDCKVLLLALIFGRENFLNRIIWA